MNPDISVINLTTDHPDELYCPICGCGKIIYWSELKEWKIWPEKKRKEYEKCAACGYGFDDFDYDDFM